MNSDDYIFEVPIYLYESTDMIHPLLELYRLKLMETLIKNLKKQINSKLKEINQVSSKKIRQYFSQLLMNIYTEKTFTTKFDIIKLDDGLFNLPINSELEDFYRDLNYSVKEEIFVYDEFYIEKSIKNILIQIKIFSEEISDQTPNIYQFIQNKFIIHNEIFLKYQLTEFSHLLQNLLVDQEIIDKTKKKYSGPPEKYEIYLLCCLIRYQSFGSGANQFVVDISYKKQLEIFGFNFECFASALNHFYDYYCSIFYDIEKYFGSKGSFMALKIIKGCYMANPPYDNNLLNKMYSKVKSALSSSYPISFIMSIPKWKDFNLEKQIDKEHFYSIRQIKYEYFMNPVTKKKILIPPYVSYLFYNNSFNKENNDFIEKLKILFRTFTNYNLEISVRNKIYDTEYKKIIFKKLLNENLKEIVNEKKVEYPNVKLNNIDYLYNGEYHYLVANSHKYKYYMLSDLFNDECRIMCSFDDNITPNKYFTENKYKIIESLINKNIPITPISIREQIYLSVKECSTHNPLLIKTFIEKYSAKKILDISSGWGDRLIGALLSDIDLYLGVDPNKCLHPNYREMIKILKPFSPNQKAKYVMIESPFEKYNLPSDIIFDLIYTSPPYFDYEDYSTSKTQSIKNYNSENEWLTKFLYVSIDKSLKNLKNGGHIALYISQKKGKTYTEKLIKWMKIKSDLYYLGNFFKSDENLKKIHPIFIFQKNQSIPKQLYDPPIVITSIKNNNINLNIIHEDLLIGGTKIRASVNYLKDLLNKNPNIIELVYTGASNGYGQIAIAYSLYLLKSNVNLRIYYQPADKLSDINKIQNLTKYLYSRTIYVRIEQKLSNIWKIIEKYVEDNSNSMKISFGLDNPQFKNYLFESLQVHLTPYINKIKRLWLVAGSGTIYSILYKILEKTKFNLIQVGKKVTLSPDEQNRTKLYTSSYKLYENLTKNIPYPTVKSYDGKIWEFSEEFIDNDYIWNVAGIHNKI